MYILRKNENEFRLSWGMKFFNRWKYILAVIGVILTVLIAFSILDIIIAFFYLRFYTHLSFIVSFGVGGIFAGVFGYVYAIQLAPEKNEFARWSLISTILFMGLLIFFFFSKLEGGEYEPAFKAFGATLALASLLFIKGKVEV